MPKSAGAPAERGYTLPAIAHDVYRNYLHGKSMSAIAREFTLDPRTVKRYIDALLKEQQPARGVSRDRLRQEALAKLRQVHQHAWALLDQDPTDTAALNVVVRAIREEAKLQGLYEDVTVSVEHRGAVEIRVVYKNDWRGGGPRPSTIGAGAPVAPTVVDAEVMVATASDGEAEGGLA